MFENRDFQPEKAYFAKDVNVRESEKLSEIRNHRGMLCYTVAMTTYDNFRLSRRMYQIEVVSHYNYIEPLIVFHKDNILNYPEAEKVYNEIVDRYTYLTKAQNKDIEDIEIFKDKILYQQTECCLNCRFCRQIKVPFKYVPSNKDHFPYDEEYYCRTPLDFEVRLECHHPEIFRHNNDNLCNDECCDDLCKKLMDQSGHFDINYSYCNHKHHTINLHPEVKADCICKFYKKQMMNKHKNEVMPDQIYKDYVFKRHDNHGKQW